AASHDVVEADGQRPHELAGQGDNRAQQRGAERVGDEVRARQEQQRAAQREQRIAIPEQEIADGDHHFTATRPQKLYHLKKTSTARKPAPSSNSRFSSSLYGISTFSSASRFCAISVSV